MFGREWRKAVFRFLLLAVTLHWPAKFNYPMQLQQAAPLHRALCAGVPLRRQPRCLCTNEIRCRS